MRQHLRGEGPLLPEKDHPVIGRYSRGKQLRQRGAALGWSITESQIRRKMRIVQRHDEQILLTIPEPLGLLQKVGMIRTLWLYKLAVLNHLMERRQVIEVKMKKGVFSSLVLGERKFGPVEGIPVLAAAIIAPPVVLVMDVQIFGVFHQDIPLFGTSLNPKS